MNLSKLSLALSGVLAAGNAFALAPNAIDPQNPGVNDIVIHYGGATAQSQTVKNLATDLCVAGTIDHFVNLPADPTHLVVSCELTTPIAGKSNLYFSYFLDGGSVYGVTPVADQVSLNYMKVNGGSCSTPDGGSPSVNWTCANSGANQYAHAPEAGGSDVEPALFKGANVSGLAFGAASPAGLANLTVEPAFNVIFGLPVNLAMLDGSIYPGGTGTIKSLSKSSAASIFSGQKAQWDAIPEFGNLENWVNGVGAPTDIHVCRRVNGSGTQAAIQVHFLRQECTDFSRPFATAANWVVPGELEEISSSTKILTQCVDVNPRAIGVSSLEKQPGVKYGTNWAYVAIDGIMPTEENAAKGLYDYMFENSMQYNNTVVDAAQKGFLDALFAAAKDSTVLAGKPGVLGVPDYVINTPGDFADADIDGIYAEYHPSNPVAWVSRDTQGCKPQVQVFP
ncbi:MAG: hypothetical protein RRB22_02680 [Gammaproteobacteria bacterium]|nr:hypothetical protein [Gammaproteobacteria bacterium]